MKWITFQIFTIILLTPVFTCDLSYMADKYILCNMSLKIVHTKEYIEACF